MFLRLHDILLAFSTSLELIILSAVLKWIELFILSISSLRLHCCDFALRIGFVLKLKLFVDHLRLFQNYKVIAFIR